MRGTKRQVATLRNRKTLDHKKSNRAVAAAASAKSVDDGDYEDVPDSVAAPNGAAAAAGSKFHNRTLQIFLHEMRAALDQEVVVDQVGKSIETIKSHWPAQLARERVIGLI